MKEPPEMNEFFIRGISLQTALWARENWHALTDEEKNSLGFSRATEHNSNKLH